MAIEDRLKGLEERHLELKEQLDKNAATTEEIAEILRAAKSFFKFAGYFSTFVRWLAITAAALAGLWKLWMEHRR